MRRGYEVAEESTTTSGECCAAETLVPLNAGCTRDACESPLGNPIMLLAIAFLGMGSEYGRPVNIAPVWFRRAGETNDPSHLVQNWPNAGQKFGGSQCG